MIALPFKEVWLVDFEFGAPPGDIQEPVCLVAWELKSGRKLRLWRDEFGATPPYSIGTDSLFVAYFASAEIGCHLALGWPVPERVLDLFVEFRNETNGLQTISGASLLGALAQYGLDGIGAAEKDEMRDLILRGGPWSDAERLAVLDYCQTDVEALARLLPAMLPRIDLPRALLRGRYMTAVARMEYNGVPIDVPTLNLLRQHWTNIQDALIADIDTAYGVFDGRTFKGDKFAQFLAKQGIPWPRLESGRLDMSDDTFRQMARANPLVSPLRELRSSLSEMRLADLAVGRDDGRNRTLLSPFRARSGRNQPSNSKFIFGPSVWLRGLNKATTWSWRCIHRLGATRVRHCCRPIRRCEHESRLLLRRPISRFRQTGRCSTTRRHQSDAQISSGTVQTVCVGSPVWDGRRVASAPHRSTAYSSAPPIAPPSRDLSNVLELV